MKTSIPTALTSAQVIQTKIYTDKVSGLQFRTASNWRTALKQPKTGAKVTEMTTSNGYKFNLYAENQVEAFDPNAELAKKEAIKKLRQEGQEVEKLFMTHQITSEEYLKRGANIAQQMTNILG